MNTQLIQIKDESKWLEKRKGYVTSTESSALYGLSPWKTHFELWHEKHGDYSGSLEDNNFLLFGRIIEEPICEMIKIERPEWSIVPMKVFAFDDDDKIGSSYDRVVTLEDGRTALLEIKSTSYKEYKKKFTEHSEDDIEAPTQYEVQMQHELEVIGNYDLIVMAVFLADTRQIKYIFRDRDKDMGKEIRKAVKDFWSAETPPEPDYKRDKSVITSVAIKADENNIMDATKNTRISELVAMYTHEKILQAHAKLSADTFYAELVTLLKDARYAWTDDYKITCSDIKPNAGYKITPDMVGNIIDARAGFKRLTITEIKK